MEFSRCQQTRRNYNKKPKCCQ